jgi:hypothetical protein
MRASGPSAPDDTELVQRAERPDEALAAFAAYKGDVTAGYVAGARRG